MARAGPGTDKLPARRRGVSSWRAGPGTDKLPARRREELSWQGLDQEQTNYQPDGEKS